MTGPASTHHDDLGRVDALRGQLDRMLTAMETLVSVESPSTDLAATDACATVVGDLGADLLGQRPESVDVDGNHHLRWVFGEPRVLLLGHLDTVWPLGTLGRWPFEIADGRATGPGVFDMKAGLVQGLFGISLLDDLDGICVLVTSDEEIGSPTSRRLIEETARGTDAVLVLEPSATGGALKTGRKGVSNYHLKVRGKAAHAGLDPERGVNALVEAAQVVLAVTQVARPEAGTTVTPTRAAAGTATNVVPAEASVDVDVRVATTAEQGRVDQAVHALQPTTTGASLEINGGPNRPPLQESNSRDLFALATDAGRELGLDLQGTVVGGASDGNFTAGIGVPTLDGLGAVGDGAHAEGEYIEVAAIPERAALVAALTDRLRQA